LPTSTHFGFETISETEKSTRVGAVFRSVARNYDVMNDLMSAGMHRWWKRFAVEQSGVREGSRVLDVAAGTGDLTVKFVRKAGLTGQVVLTDINPEMLKYGRDRVLDCGSIVPVIRCNAESLPFTNDYFDCVCVAFGLRNMTHKERALEESYRVLRPGGRILILEFSHVWRMLKPAYDIFSFNVLPALGKWVAHDADAYRYLAESIRVHPTQEELKQMMDNAGFEGTQYFNLLAGVVALHKGYKY
jgi:demethylmenaquinone methyltransferase / 2-methoxy-6-polyprenyl-1,4-benzoquinol methylase